MKGNFEEFFGQDHGIIIGAIHLPPISVPKDYPGFDTALRNALFDLNAFEKGGVDAVIIENNYDAPHTEFISEEEEQEIARLARALRQVARIPVGVSVLWNDYRAALRIAKEISGSFVRVPVFVDTVRTNYGIISGNPDDVVSYRKKIEAESVKIYTDIHVKHASLLSSLNLTESAMLAIKKGSDALIITGKWTGDAPNINDLKQVRKSVGDFPILCGSGIDIENIKSCFAFADGAIVSTSLKEGSSKEGEINVKPYNARVNAVKVKALISANV